MEIVESRIERRMERLLDDKVELSIARMKSKLKMTSKHGPLMLGRVMVQIRRKIKTNNAVIDRVNEVYERVIALGGKLAEEAQRRGIINNQLRSEMRQMQTNIEKAMAPDDTIEDKITAAVAKAMVAERQDSRRLRAMESQQMSAELENVRSSLLKEIEKRDVIIKDLTERVMKAHMMAATAVRPQGPPPTTPHPSELAKKAPKNNNKRYRPNDTCDTYENEDYDGRY